jgi:outer membrane receptor protein involved in Fe transport
VGSGDFRNYRCGAGGAGNTPLSRDCRTFLLGRITTPQGVPASSRSIFEPPTAAAYVQDDWKVTPRLTLNLGVRWEGLSTAHEKFNFLSNFRGLGDGQPPPISIIHPEDTPRVRDEGCEQLHTAQLF